MDTLKMKLNSRSMEFEQYPASKYTSITLVRDEKDAFAIISFHFNRDEMAELKARLEVAMHEWDEHYAPKGGVL